MSAWGNGKGRQNTGKKNLSKCSPTAEILPRKHSPGASTPGEGKGGFVVESPRKTDSLHPAPLPCKEAVK